jgi:enoyl-CoA hydratase/carnithine racemase
MTNQENRHNLEFGRAMLKVLKEIKDDKSVTAVILASDDPKSWCQGVDVNWIMAQFAEKNFDDIKAFMYVMNDVFKEILLFPVPVIAAISGHTFGNGAILACACDFRMMKSDRGYFCLPEVDLGIPFLPSMIKTVQKSVPYYKFNEMTLTGKRYGAKDLFKHNVLEMACENAQELFKEALLFAQTFNKKRGIFSEHKKRFHKHIVEAMEKEDKEFIESLALFISD